MVITRTWLGLAGCRMFNFLMFNIMSSGVKCMLGMFVIRDAESESKSESPRVVATSQESDSESIKLP